MGETLLSKDDYTRVNEILQEYSRLFPPVLYNQTTMTTEFMVSHISEKGISDVNEDSFLIDEVHGIFGVFDGALIIKTIPLSTR